jgi:hypothetical protein
MSIQAVSPVSIFEGAGAAGAAGVPVGAGAVLGASAIPGPENPGLAGSSAETRQVEKMKLPMNKLKTKYKLNILFIPTSNFSIG